MTSLIAWTGADSRGAASLYLASDSRISWDSESGWDVGRKLFASDARADILGYCGDVLFPALALGQVIALSNAGLLKADAAERHKEVTLMLERSLAQVPLRHRNEFVILHGARQAEGMASHFRLWHTSWSSATGWTDREVTVPPTSSLILALGTGGSAVMSSNFTWSLSESGGTSRAVFSAFCDALAAKADPRSGGPAQLVGLYRKGNGLAFGTVHDGEAFLYGMPVATPDRTQTIEWRNELFERCDGVSLRRLDGAQPQPRPNSLNRG